MGRPPHMYADTYRSSASRAEGIVRQPRLAQTKTGPRKRCNSPVLRNLRPNRSGNTNVLAREEERRVSIKPLKSWAVEKLPSGSKLRGLILAELESMDPQEFCSKVQTWLLLANETMSNRSLEKGSLIFLRYMD